MVHAPRSATGTFLTRCLISLLIASVCMVGIVAAVNRGIDDRVDKIERVTLAVAPAPPEGANYLIIGSDTRAFVDNSGDAGAFGDAQSQGGQRSDTLMVAHVEPGSQRTVVVSFPRDLMVNVPGVSGKTRINSAYSLGGPQLVIDTLDANFGIKINHYLEVDFKSFEAVVDAIGKVNIYIPGQLRDVNEDGTLGGSGFQSIFGAGCYAFGGAAALAYVRARHMQIADPNGPYVDEHGTHWRLLDVRSDLDRIQRQQNFVRELAAVAIRRSLNDPFTAVEVSDNVLGYLKADSGLSRGDVNVSIRAFRTVDVADQDSIQFETIPVAPDPNNPNVTLVPAADADTVLDKLRTFGDNAAKSPLVPPAQVKVLVRDGTQTSNASGVAAALADQGFVSLGTGSPTKNDIAVSEVRYGANMADLAKTVLDYIPDAKLVADKSLDGTSKIVLVLGRSFTAISVPATPTTAPPVDGAPTTTAPPTTTTTLPPNSCPN